MGSNLISASVQQKNSTVVKGFTGSKRCLLGRSRLKKLKKKKERKSSTKITIIDFQAFMNNIDVKRSEKIGFRLNDFFLRAHL